MLKSSSSVSFAIKVTFISQVIFLLVFLSLWMSAGEYILFAIGILFVIDLIVATVSFISGLLFFRPKPSSNFIQKKYEWLINICLLILATAMFIMMFFPLFREVANEVVESTQSHFLAVMLDPFVDERIKLTINIKNAAETGDMSLCEAMSDNYYVKKNYCYSQVDPDYKMAWEKCDLYTKFVGPNASTAALEDQSRCVIHNLAAEQYEQKTLDCSTLVAGFKSQYSDLISSQCNVLETLQEVVLSGQPSNCDHYSEDSGYARALCYSEFVDTPESNQFCREEGAPFYKVLAGCEGSVLNEAMLIPFGFERPGGKNILVLFSYESLPVYTPDKVWSDWY